MNSILVRRVGATQGVVDAWRFRPFAWGEADCARLAAAMLAALGWRPGVARFGYYRTAKGALSALRKRGFDDLAGVMAGLGAPAIPYASALPGDILGFRHPDQPGGVALGVALGNGRALGFMDNGDGLGHACHVFPPVLTADGAEFLAWRADPR